MARMAQVASTGKAALLHGRAQDTASVAVLRPAWPWALRNTPRDKLVCQTERWSTRASWFLSPCWGLLSVMPRQAPFGYFQVIPLYLSVLCVRV